MSGITSNLKVTLFSTGNARAVDFKVVMTMVVGLLIVAAPIEYDELEFVLVGAVCFAALRLSHKVTRSKRKKNGGAAFAALARGQISTCQMPLLRTTSLRETSPERISQPVLLGRTRLERSSFHASSSSCELKETEFSSGDKLDVGIHQKTHIANIEIRDKVDSNSWSRAKHGAKPVGKQELRQVSVQPVLVPTFVAHDFDTQVHELLAQIAPSAEGDKLVQDISLAVKTAISNLVPDADVMGFANADVLRGTAFAVAIPEVEIILFAEPNAITERLQGRASRPLPHASKLDARTLQKALLRACTDELAAAPCFKFRRSAFKGQEPKVTLMAEVHGKSIPIDFSVNTTTPLYNAALLTECGQIEPRAKELILFVKRWAKDRGVSHAAKGHLSPYAWSLLVIYFLQVCDERGEPLLSNIASFKTSSGLLRKQQKERLSRLTDAVTISSRATSVACLFEEFIHFYTKKFNWRNEAVSVRAGTRRPPSLPLQLHCVILESGATDVAPSVEDPFAPRRNLSGGMTALTLGRLHEELARAEDILARRASLSELVEPWVPPEQN